MKFIAKEEAPKEYQEYCKRKEASYDDLREENREVYDKLRVSLLEEQGYICCYCGRRITLDNVTVEHLKPRDKYKKLELAYSNLLASCEGGQNKRRKNKEASLNKNERDRQFALYCNCKKGNSEIPVTPLIDNCEERFKYDDKGNILCKEGDTTAEDTINILNLNNSTLKNLRKAAITTIMWCKDETQKKQQEEIARISSKQNNDGIFGYLPFCFVMTSYLESFFSASEVHSCNDEKIINRN